MYGVVLMAASFCSGRWRSPLPKQCLILRCTFDSVLVHLHTLVFVHWWPPLPKQCLTLRCTGATSSRCICGYDLNLVLNSQVKSFCWVIIHLDRDFSLNWDGMYCHHLKTVTKTMLGRLGMWHRVNLHLINVLPLLFNKTERFPKTIIPGWSKKIAINCKDISW